MYARLVSPSGFQCSLSTIINLICFSGDKERINELVQKAWIFINDR